MAATTSMSARSPARWCGRHAATRVLASIRWSCPTATTSPTARCRRRSSSAWLPAKSACRIARVPSHCSWRAPLSSPDLIAKDRGNGLFGVYVHWPFCAAKCPYCDFNSHVHRGEFDEAGYVDAYRQEMAHFAHLPTGRTVQSIFFGGGTPSLMHPRSVGAILAAIGKNWNIAPDAEITLEANPTSVEADRFRGYRAAGVNRVSLGVQSLREGPLAELGRRHTVDEGLRAVRQAQSIFPRSSFDLIYARPKQVLSD